jgi:hypothetical protein
MKTLPPFPLVSGVSYTYSRLPIVFHLTKALSDDNLQDLAGILHVPAKAMRNNYRFYFDRIGKAPFESILMSKLKQPPDTYGTYCIGVTVMPADLMRYGQLKTEFLRDLKDAGRGVVSELRPKDSWHDHVKNAYSLMLQTSRVVKAFHQDIPTRHFVSDYGFSGLHVVVHESQVMHVL